MSSYNNDPNQPPVGGVDESLPYVRPEGAETEFSATTDVTAGTAKTPTTQTTGGGQAKERAKDAADSVRGPATDVKDTAVSAGKDVVETAKAEAGQVVDEAKHQGRRLLDESVSELRTQASSVQARLADTVQALSDELRAMASTPDADGAITQLAHTGHDYGDRAAAWLRDNDLDQALSGVRRYAARNPWAFLAIAGGAGLLVGRLARGLRDAGQPDTTSYRQSYVGYDDQLARDRTVTGTDVTYTQGLGTDPAFDRVDPVATEYDALRERRLGDPNA